MDLLPPHFLVRYWIRPAPITLVHEMRDILGVPDVSQYVGVGQFYIRPGSSSCTLDGVAGSLLVTLENDRDERDLSKDCCLFVVICCH